MCSRSEHTPGQIFFDWGYWDVKDPASNPRIMLEEMTPRNRDLYLWGALAAQMEAQEIRYIPEAHLVE